MLYVTLREITRVVEQVEVTEEGVFVKGDTPSSYGGAKLTVEIVHEVKMADNSGRMQIMKLSNTTPLDKNKAPSPAGITQDGNVIVAGTGTPRIWTTREASNLDPSLKSIAGLVDGYRTSDGDRGSYI